ncbi:protocadherin gamma subfamily A, 3 L homeolog isoform X28 [Xenopus laevis]|uniref:Protocadherin gamma subfamily A, 3 L homeolog isoform X28 n=1 Tax=Xenopus laevis TaxID=8355 RepID=A0A8J1MIF5_XENLA|nr:protocadherin gamma subfamily A, 3 L homeolog isoform X28 [Xenopus laevis]
MCKTTFHLNKSRTMAWQVIYFFISFMCKALSGQIQFSIFEELRKGSVVGNIANDLSLNVKELSSRNFHIVSRAKTQHFSVNLENGELLISERIDRETLCGTEQNCFLNIEAVIEKPLHFYTFQVEIKDVNDNLPSFSKKSFDIGISESALPGDRFTLGHAQDPDLGTNSVQHYELIANEYFSLSEKNSVDGSEPELVLERPLDREKQSSIELSITASDGGRPMRTGTALIKIVVLDVNDNYPVFSQETYQIHLRENIPDNFIILQLNATDGDEGSNAQITYSFSHIPEDAGQIFKLDSQTGEIAKIGTLDYETAKNYKITVEAKDGGGLATHSKVLIQIVDDNDNAPEIQINSLTSVIPEDSPPGTVVALINIQDLDSGGNAEFDCQISTNVPFQLISLPNNYFKMVTSSSMDREVTSEYKINIVATDKGLPPLSTSKTIQLTVSDVNDNVPVFEKATYIAYVPENNVPGTSIHRIIASDLDLNENGQIIYSLISNNTEDALVSSHVSINSITGVVYALHSFDYEQIREFHFQVIAKDGGSPPLNNSVTVKICIVDRNDNAPKILYPSSDSERTSLFEFIPRSSKRGYLVTKVIAVDADTGHNAWLFYQLLQVPEPSLFTIGQHTGEIRISRDFQEMDTLKQKIVVLVKDNGDPSLTATVALNLVIAENFHVLPELTSQPIKLETTSNITFFLVLAIAMISILFILTVIVAVISKCKTTNTSTLSGTLNKGLYPQVALHCASEFSDGTLPLPFPYELCVAIDSSQNEFAYLRPIQNVPTDNLIDTGDSSDANTGEKGPLCDSNIIQQAQPNADWRFSQAAQKPGPSGTQPTEEAGVWPNNQFETERLQAMILASANEAAEGTSGLGGGTGTMGLSARYGPQFTLQHVPDYRQNVYIPGSTLTPTNGGGKREGKGNKKKSSKKDKK